MPGGSFIIGHGHNLSTNVNPPANDAFPFFIISNILRKGSYKFSSQLKGENTNTAELALYSFYSDGGKENYGPFNQFFDLKEGQSNYTFTFDINDDYPYRLLLYSSPGGSGTGKELLYVSNATLIKLK